MKLVEKIRIWFSTHLISPLREMSWLERFLLISFGFWFGIFPVPGLSTTLLLLSFLFINRNLDHPISVSESTVATAVNVLSTPICIALMPFWMWMGSIIFQPEMRCKASVIIDMLYVSYELYSLTQLATTMGS